MKSRGIFCIAILICFVMPCVLQAAWLSHIPQQLFQPDGSVLNCFASGDEFSNYLHDADGFTIVRHPQTGYYVYAEQADSGLKPSAIIAQNGSGVSKSVQKWIRPDEAHIQRKIAFYHQGMKSGPLVQSPTRGQLNNVVIYIRFSDEAEINLSSNVFEGKFNTDDISLNQYFQSASYHQLDVHSVFYPETDTGQVRSYQDSHSRSYYQVYHETANPDGYSDETERADREHTLLRNAVQAVAAQISGNIDVDADDDGYVDNVVFMLSGGPEGWSDLLWPHRWVLYLHDDAMINGARVYDYNLNFTEGDYSDVGVLCHEFFHTLGAPDLYHYDHDGMTPVGPWDLMEETGDIPQQMMAYMKYRYGGWIDEIPLLTAHGRYTLNPLTSPSGQCFRIASSHTLQEYYVIEYRRQEDLFDSSIPGSGLLAYRINTDADGEGNRELPDEVYVYRPGGTPNEDGLINRAFFSADVNRTAIHDMTNPAAFLQDGTYGGLKITEIGEAGSTVSFKFGDIARAQVVPEAVSLTLEQFDSTNQVLTLTNTGEAGSLLDYRIQLTGNTADAMGEPSIAGSDMSCQPSFYESGTTFDLVLTVVNRSADVEFIAGIGVDFPAGVTVNQASNFTGGASALVWDGGSGNGSQVLWTDENGAWGNIEDGETAQAVVNVTIDDAVQGDLALDWLLTGEVYGEEPHDVSGTLVLSQTGGQNHWLTVSPAAGQIPSGESTNMMLHFDASALAVNTYEASLILSHADEDPLTVPIHLTVIPAVPRPEIAVWPEQLHFGNVLADSASALELYVMNHGDADLNITAVTLTGGDMNCFAFLSGGMAVTLAPGDTHAIEIVFQPNSTGEKTVDLLIESNDADENPLRLPLTGTGVELFQAAVWPDSLNQTLVQGDTAFQILRIENRMLETPTPFTLSIQDKEANARRKPEPSIAGSLFECSTAVYNSGETVDLILSVTNNSDDVEWLTRIEADFPTGITVNNASNFQGGHRDLMVNENRGDGCLLIWTDQDGGFGNIWDNETAHAVVNVTVDDDFSGNLDIDWLIQGEGWGEEPHQLTGTLTLTREEAVLPWMTIAPRSGIINPGQTETLSVHFESADLEPDLYQADLLFTFLSGEEISIPASLQLIEAGQYPEIAVLPDSLPFGQIETGDTASRTIVMSNAGAGNLTFSSIYLAGDHADAFRIISGDSVQILTPGQTQYLTVDFMPRTIGWKTATLNIDSNDPDEARLRIPLTGMGMLRDYAPPDIVYGYPSAGAVYVPLNPLLQVSLRDAGYGLNVNSVRMTLDNQPVLIDGLDQTGGHVQLMHTLDGCRIHYLPHEDLKVFNNTTVSIQCEDLHDPPNSMDTTYSFMTGLCPVMRTKMENISETGGLVKDKETGLETFFPKGAVEDTLIISLGLIRIPPELPDTIQSVGWVYSLGPAALPLKIPAEAAIPYTEFELGIAGVKAAEDLSVFCFSLSAGVWEEAVVTTVGDDHITAEIKDGCYFCLSRILPQNSGVLRIDKPLPHQFALHPNFPNPFNPETHIHYELPEPCHVCLHVFDVAGRQVAALVDEVQTAGHYEAIWQGINTDFQSVPSGIYFVSLRTKAYTKIQKMMLIR